MNKDVVVPVVLGEDVYYVHARIVGAFWNGYIVHQNEYFLPLPSATNVDTLVRMAEEAIRRRKEAS